MKKLRIIKSQFRALIIKCKKINSTTKNPSDGHYPFQVPSSKFQPPSLSLSVSLFPRLNANCCSNHLLPLRTPPTTNTRTTHHEEYENHPPRIREPPITKNTRTTHHEYENHPRALTVIFLGFLCSPSVIIRACD